MQKFQNQYRIPSTRLQNWDYAKDGAYFITICTDNRQHYFGEIVEGKMQLSPIGVIADVLWYEIKIHAKNIELGEFVVMPNHVHGILLLSGNDEFVRNVDAVETTQALSLQPKTTIGHNRFQNQGKNSISSIIGGYKSAVSKHVHRLNFEFEWQSGFYDHIIRNNDSFQRISDYIINNPKKWKEDKFFNAK